jgi:homoserine kinase type II
MSVYTNVLPHELDEFLENYSLGQLQQFAGISDGIENTNYFVTSSKGQYVLTLFEVLTLQELPYFLELMAFLAEADIPCAHPVADNNGDYFRVLNGKPAALVKRLNGTSIDIPNSKQCRSIGKHMARMHVASSKFDLTRKPVRDLEWRVQTAERVMLKLNKEEQELLQQELAYHDTTKLDGLPVSLIHADLFRDNALFIDDELTGIIDFYDAHNGPSIYDLAVTVNDWCMSGDIEHDQQNAVALLQAYQTVRTVEQQEHDAWVTVLRAAALRFWLSRLLNKYFPRDGEITHIKDPDVYRRIIEYHVDHPEEVMGMWVSPPY